MIQLRIISQLPTELIPTRERGWRSVRSLPTTPFYRCNCAGILASTTNAADVPVTLLQLWYCPRWKLIFNWAVLRYLLGIYDGEAYNPTRGYGWVMQSSLSSMTHTPLSIAAYARDRNRAVDQRRLIPCCICSFQIIPCCLEYSVPNGTYSVTTALATPTSSGVTGSTALG